MKAVKIALLALVVLFVLLVVGVIGLMLPGVQQFLVARLVVSEPDESLEMDYLHIGLGRTEARDVRFVQGDAAYRVAELTADLSLSSLLFGGELRLGDVVATGVELELPESDSDDDSDDDEDSEPFEGFLRELELPMPLYLDSVRAEGKILFPETEGSAPVASEFVITGGDFAPNADGALQFSGDLELTDAAVVLDGLVVDGNLHVHQGEGGRIERARLLAQVSLDGIRAESDEKLQAEVVMLATDEGEAYQASFGRLITAGSAGAQPDLSTLVTLDASFSREAGVLEGSWEVDIDREQLAAFVGEMELPVFTATGSGTFSYGGEAGIELAGNLDVSVEDLGLLAAELEELGGFTLQSQFDLTMDDARLHLEELVLALNDADGSLLEVRNFQPLRYNRETQQVEGADARMNLAEVTIHGLPVEWANLFLASAEGGQDTTVQGGDLTGQLVVGTEAGGIFLNLVEPLRVNGLSVLSGEEPLLADLSVEASGSGSFQDGELTAGLEDLRVYQDDALVLAGSASFDAAANQARANLQGDLPLLLDQPVLDGVATLSSGLLDLGVTANFADGLELELDGTASNLASPAAEGEPLPELAIQAHVRQTGDNSWEVDVPVRVEGQTASELRLAGTLRPGGEVTQFALEISGEQVALDEVLALSSAFGGGGETSGESGAPTGGAGASVAADEEAAWAGLDGTVTVNVGKIVVQSEYELRELTGELAVQAEAVTTSLSATLLESPVELGARVGFLAGEAQPYVLEGLLEAPELAAAELFRQLQPNRPPTLEGIFAISVELEGAGRTLGDLIERVRGQVHLQSGGGIIRLLYSENPLMGIGSAAGTLLGTFVEEVGAVTKIADHFSNMPYDEMNIRAERDEELNIVLQELTVLSPEVHLQGVGQVSYRQNLPILQQPMNLKVRLGAKGELEQMLAEVQVLGKETDELDYRYMRRDFVIGGTPANPDTRVFYRILLDAVMQFVSPEDEEGTAEEEQPPLIPEIPDVFDDLFRGIGGRLRF